MWRACSGRGGSRSLSRRSSPPPARARATTWTSQSFRNRLRIDSTAGRKMKRRLVNMLLPAALLLLCCGTAAAAQTEPCRLERAVAPDYGGVMLGTKLEALAQMFPGSEDLQKGAQVPSDS